MSAGRLFDIQSWLISEGFIVVSACAATYDLFFSRIKQMVDLRQPLAVLYSRLPWQEMEAHMVYLFVRKPRTGKSMRDLEFFGKKSKRVATVRNVDGRVPLRVMDVLHCLKHTLDESDKGVAESWCTSINGQAAQPKPHFGHAPGVNCIGQSEVRRPLEFGVKVATASTFKNILMQDCGHNPPTGFVGLGYWGVDAHNPHAPMANPGKVRKNSSQEMREWRGRQATRSKFEHLRADHCMSRCQLKGEQGHQMNAVLCAAGYLLGLLRRIIFKEGVMFSRQLYLRLREATGLHTNWFELRRYLAAQRLQ